MAKVTAVEDQAPDSPPIETTPDTTDAPPEGTTPAGGVSEHRDFTYVDPSAALTSRIQRALGKRGLYRGPANGKMDKDTSKAIQNSLGGFDGRVDGNLDRLKSVHAIQDFAKTQGSFVGPVDDRLSDVVWAGYVVGLEKE